MPDRENILPTSLPPRGLSRVQAAAYIGVSPTLFDQMVDDGRMPKPIRINARVLWDRLQLDEAFAGLASKEECSAAMPDDYAKPPRA
jgi:predicted DNA-binding transcriptional regulator AlpA